MLSGTFGEVFPSSSAINSWPAPVKEGSVPPAGASTGSTSSSTPAGPCSRRDRLLQSLFHQHHCRSPQRQAACLYPYHPLPRVFRLHCLQISASARQTGAVLQSSTGAPGSSSPAGSICSGLPGTGDNAAAHLEDPAMKLSGGQDQQGNETNKHIKITLSFNPVFLAFCTSHFPSFEVVYWGRNDSSPVDPHQKLYMLNCLNFISSSNSNVLP